MLERIPIPNPFGWAGISTYSIMVMIAFLVGSYLLPRELKRRGLKAEESDNFILIAVVGAIIGAKIFYVFEIADRIFVETPGFDGKYLYPLTNWYGFPGRPGLWSSLFSGGGLVFYGGFLVSFLSFVIYFRMKKFDAASYLDAMVPTMAIGYAIGRLGCFVSGDGCYGFAAEFEIPLLSFKYGGAFPTQVPVWNTPIFESIFSFLFFLYFHYYARFQNLKKWSLVAQYFVLSGIARLVIEFFRINKAVIPFFDPPDMVNIDNSSEFLNNYYWHGFSQSQYIALIIIFIGLFLIIRNRLWEKKKS